LVQSVSDSEDPFIKKYKFPSSSEHYLFNQMIQGIPVYYATLAVHVRNKNEIYAVQGNLVLNQTVNSQHISDEQAKEIALIAAQKENPKEQLKVVSAQRYIFNKRITSWDLADDTNYLTLAVRIIREINKNSVSYNTNRMYFVDLTSGLTIYADNYIGLPSDSSEGYNRHIFDCRSGVCLLVRAEGQPAAGGDGFADQLYTNAGHVYDWYWRHFQRKGLDGKGGPVNFFIKDNLVYGNLPNGGSCPGAMAYGDNTLDFCPLATLGTYAAGYEMNHIVEFASHAFTNQFYETVSLNEAMSGIFTLLFTEEWPDKWPDDTVTRLFSPKWDCSKTFHNRFNKDVIVHTAYLMVKGGNFNSCKVSPLGADTVANISYQALTRYFSPTSNYKDYYTAMLNACNDLYTIHSDICKQVRNALLAAELDQQPLDDLKGPLCSKKKAVAPSCQ